MKTQFQGLGHIAVYTQNLAESIAFYERIGGQTQQQAVLPTPDGDKHLALVSFGGVTLELIQSPAPMPMQEGCIPHFALCVEDVDAAAAALEAAGVHTFTEPEKKVLPHLFGGLENRFFTGPSGEQIELLHML